MNRALSAWRIVPAFLILALLAVPATAATFSVDPNTVTLATSNASASIAVTNQSQDPLRLQLTGFAWHQSASGEMQLSAAQDLVFFPDLVTLKPGETRRIRVGVTSPATPVEQSYRIFLQELPSLESVKNPKSASIAIRVKVGVPIFLSPTVPAVQKGSVENASVRDGVLAFDVRNDGNVHFAISQAHVTARSASGGDAFSKDVTGWYVLPGETRHFALPIAKAACDELKTLTVQVDANPVKFGQTFTDIHKQCAPPPHS